MNRSHLQLIISLVFLLLDSMPANALTLGRLQVNSAMGEPLKAEIEVTRFSAEELQGLTARIASPSSYRNDGLSYSPTLSGVTPQIEMRGNDRPFIVLTGTSPVNETFLDVILQTKWSTGDLIKRYSVLLNTSNDNPVRQTSAESTRLTPSLPIIPKESDGAFVLNEKKIPVYRFDAPAVAATPLLNSPSVVQVSAVKEPVSSKAFLTEPDLTSRQMTVLQGQTASQLVLAHSHSNVSLSQMLMALLKRNPHAFIEGNVNLLKAGSQLQMPTVQEAQEMSSAQARENIVLQNDHFNAYTRRLAESPLNLSAKSSGRDVSGKVSRNTPKSQDTNGSSHDQLSLATVTTKGQQQTEKLAQERKEKDAKAQIEALKQTLEQLQSLSNEKDHTKNSLEPNAPVLENQTLAKIDANEKAPRSSDEPFDIMNISQELQVWAVAALAGVAAILIWLLLRRGNKQRTHQTDLGPDLGQGNQHTANTFAHSGLSPEISRMDLNLNPHTHAPAHSGAENTELSKLRLATQLLSSGEIDLASTLLRSVASTSSGDLQSRAMKLLATIR